MKSRIPRTIVMALMRTIPTVTCIRHTVSIKLVGELKARGVRAYGWVEKSSTDTEVHPCIHSQTESERQTDIEQLRWVLLRRLRNHRIASVRVGGHIGCLGSCEGEEQKAERSEEFSDDCNDMSSELGSDGNFPDDVATPGMPFVGRFGRNINVHRRSCGL